MKIRETCEPKEEPKVIKLGDLGMGDVFEVEVRKIFDPKAHSLGPCMKCSKIDSRFACAVALSTGATYTWDKATVISKVYPNAELILEGC